MGEETFYGDAVFEARSGARIDRGVAEAVALYVAIASVRG